MMQISHPSADEIWQAARSICIGKELSEERLLALSRIHISFHTLAVSFRDDDETEERYLIKNRVEELFNEWYRRYHQSDNLQKLALLIPLFYRLAMPYLVPVKDSMLAKCDTLAERSTDLWIERNSTTGWEEEHGMMRAAIALADDMEEQNPVYQKYRNILHQWEQTLSEDYEWEGISDAEALSRIEIMYRHFYLQSDYPHIDILTKSYRHYKQRLSIKELPSATQLFLLDLEIRAVDGQNNDEVLIEEIQDAAYTSIGKYSPEQDEFWTMMSIIAECCCLRYCNGFDGM